MTDKIFNLALKYPGKIQYFGKLLEDEKEVKILNKIFDIWIKTGKVPSLEVVSKISGINVKECEIDEGDYQLIIDEVNSLIKKEIALDVLSKDDYDIKDLNARWEDEIIKTGISNITTTSSMEDVKKDLQNIKNESIKRVTTNFQQFDEILSKHGVKGWACRYVYLFQGLTGSGKTFFLTNIAMRALMQGLKVAYVSIEMDASQIRDLLYRSYFNVSDVNNIQPQTINWKLTTFVYTNKSKTIDDVLFDIRHQPIQFDLVVVDYLDNFLPSRSFSQAWQEHEIISGDMTRLAQELNVPVITASQTNRKAAGEKGGTKRYVGYEDTGSSFNKTHTMAGIWSIITDDSDYDDATGCRKYELITNKNREGKQIKLHFILNYHNARLYEKHELTGKTDSFIQQASIAEKSLHVGTKKETQEQKKETLTNYETYFEKLKDDLNYKKEVDGIDKEKLDIHQKSKLKDDIMLYQEKQKENTSPTINEDIKQKLDAYTNLIGNKRRKV